MTKKNLKKNYINIKMQPSQCWETKDTIILACLHHSTACTG